MVAGEVDGTRLLSICWMLAYRCVRLGTKTSVNGDRCAYAEEEFRGKCKRSCTTALPGTQAGARGRRREPTGRGTPLPHTTLGAAAAQRRGAGTHGGGRQHVAAGTPLGGMERAGENPCKALGVQAGRIASLFVTTAYHWGYVEFREPAVLQPMIGNAITHF